MDSSVDIDVLSRLKLPYSKIDIRFPCQLQKKSNYSRIPLAEYGIFGPKWRVAYVHRQ